MRLVAPTPTLGQQSDAYCPSGETVPGSGGRLLCSGWWGLSRHVNYCGEIVQAVALARSQATKKIYDRTFFFSEIDCL